MSLLKSISLHGTLWLCGFVALISPAHGVVVNDLCKFNETQEGRCLTWRDCQKNHPKGPPEPTFYCGRERGVSLICCPLLRVASQSQKNPTIGEEVKPGDVAKEWCNYYTATSYKGRNCAASKTEEVNEPAQPNEFPYMAAIGYGERDRIIWGCGGTLISENFVLTAAQCLQYGSFPATWVRLGAVRTQNNLRDAESEGQTHPVISSVKYPAYRASSKYFDIALLKIGAPLEANALSLISESIHPACLQVDEEEISEAIVTGWGYGNRDTLYLQKLRTNIYDMAQCNQTFKSEILETQQLLRGIDESMMCAKSIDTSKGESGGSLQIIREEGSCKYEIIGVTSFSKSHGHRDAIAVYSRVPFYLNWIEDQVWKGRQLCSLSDKQHGECKQIKDCGYAITLINKGEKPENCGFKGIEPMVCCPFGEGDSPSPVTDSSSVSEEQTGSHVAGGKALQACNSYKSVCTLKSDDSQQYPYLAVIGYGPMEDIQWGCGGSLISERFVLIAAHCISDSKKRDASFVRLGSHSAETCCRKSSNGLAIGQVHPILNIILHPQYDESKKLNDLALLKIGVAVEPASFSTLSNSIHPACLQTSKSQVTKATGLGISDIGTGDDLQLKIQKANFERFRDLEGGILNAEGTHYCEYSVSCTQVSSSGRTSCQFTTEGPLLIPDQEGSCLPVVAGILTQGQLCSNNSPPIIYTQIQPHLKWIEDNVWR